MKAAAAHASGIYDQYINTLKDLHLLNPEEQKYQIGVIEEMQATAADLLELGVYAPSHPNYANLKRMSETNIERLLVMNKRAYEEHKRLPTTTR